MFKKLNSFFQNVGGGACVSVVAVAVVAVAFSPELAVGVVAVV